MWLSKWSWDEIILDLGWVLNLASLQEKGDEDLKHRHTGEDPQIQTRNPQFPDSPQGVKDLDLTKT